mmetsp:Transcript_9275/g.26040  ORF Transcript_9275/g.26040 Transcript_9275/m.26040 type:complete len:233 (-) Transcript_9275:6-704(-)
MQFSQPPPLGKQATSRFFLFRSQILRKPPSSPEVSRPGQTTARPQTPPTWPERVSRQAHLSGPDPPPSGSTAAPSAATEAWEMALEATKWAFPSILEAVGRVHLTSIESWREAASCWDARCSSSLTAALVVARKSPSTPSTALRSLSATATTCCQRWSSRACTAWSSSRAQTASSAVTSPSSARPSAALARRGEDGSGSTSPKVEHCSPTLPAVGIALGAAGATCAAQGERW